MAEKRRALNHKIYVATVAEAARENALRYGLGIECDEFCTAINLEDPVYIEKAHRNLEGIEHRVLHAPFNELCPAAIEPLVRKVSRYRFLQAYEMAQSLGIRRMVVHSGFVPLTYFPVWFVEQSILFWKDLLKDLPEDCELLLENVMEDEPQMGYDIVRGVDDPRLRLCLDVGHAHCVSKKVPVREWIRLWAPYLSHMHLHNNDTSWDTHSALDDGTLDMEEVLELLEEVAPQATWTLEALDADRSCRWLKENGWIEEREHELS